MTTIPSAAIKALFTDKKRKNHVPVLLMAGKEFESWLKKQSAAVKDSAKRSGYSAQAGKVFITPDADSVVAGISSPFSLYDAAAAVQAIRSAFGKDALAATSFSLEGDFKKDAMTLAVTGWALGCYQFDAYKKGAANPVLLWPKGADKKRAAAMTEALYMLRDLINTPANDMGPDEMERAAKAVATKHKAKIAVTKGAALEKDFPLIHIVGDASPRRPRLIDMTWGKASDPKITLVGKGVAFDTGGLNLKPASYMALMKKDMGGAAHVLGLAHLIMSLHLPVRLRVLIASVENSVSGSAFRPGDVFTSRKGLTVENTNTDAEGRLILADALSYACEDRPELLVDFATLTGSARAALGPDIPAVFSNNVKLADELKALSFENEDPLWPMPLWKPYAKHNDSAVADLQNSSGVPGDLVFSALFLSNFVEAKTDWVHIDTYAWEHTGRAGRPRGAADLGMRAVLALLEKRYG